MNARMQAAQVQLEPMLAPWLDAVLRVEQSAYAHPWNYTNFMDALHSGYQAQMLVCDGNLLGYFVAMQGVDEVHLLNITVAPEHQGQGWARLMLDALAQWARGQGAQSMWLEVRMSNVRAQRVYASHGYREVGRRKQYYPAGQGAREDALVMRMPLAMAD